MVLAMVILIKMKFNIQKTTQTEHYVGVALQFS